MVRSVHLSLLVALIAASGSSFAADIQLASHCGEGCDGCNDSSRSRRASRKACRNSDWQTGDYCEPCGKQRCGLRGTWRDFGTNWTGRCGPIGRAARWGFPGARCLKYCMDTKGSGDSGWAPPARMPVNRTHTGFGSFSNYGGGAYGGAPMVYQPTDTTQLGYTYAHVPTWRRNPNMIPQTPNPSNFHSRFCPRDPRCGMCIDSGAGCMMNGGYGNCMGEQIIEVPAMGGQYCPACVSDEKPAPTPSGQEVGVFRMASLRKAPSAQKPAPVVVKPPANIRLAAQAQAQPMQMNQPELQKPQIHLPKPQVQNPRPQVKLPQPQVSQPRPQVQRPAPVQRSQMQQPKQQRRTAGRRQSPKPTSGGWFGLPSLSEVKF